MVRVLCLLCWSMVLISVAMWTTAVHLMPRPRVAPTTAHRMAVCGRPVFRGHGRLDNRLVQTFWFHVLFDEDEKIRHVGDAWQVEEIAMRWFGREASELTTQESAFVAAVAANPRVVKSDRIATAVQYRLHNCANFPMQKR